MTLQLTIPDSVLQALPLSHQHIERELLKELAVALYAQELLSFGEARELAQMESCEFGQLLGERCVNRHCNRVALAADLAFACSE